MSRQNQFRCTVNIDWPGLGLIPGAWDQMTGAGRGGTSNKYRPGGMGPEISLGSMPTNDDVTVERLYQTDRDHELLPLYLAAAGRAPGQVSWSPLDANGVPFEGARGKPITYRGTFMHVNPPDHDSTSESPAKIQLVFAIEGTPG